jgi:hypothetical protein
VTRSTAAVVERLRSSGALCLCQAGVERAEWRSGIWQVRTREGPTIECDWIWLATGWTPSLADHTLLDPLQRRRPAAIAGGMPLLEDNLAWPGTPIHLTGSLAALRVGPVAPNLSGARIAAERIAGSLVPLHTRQYPT